MKQTTCIKVNHFGVTMWVLVLFLTPKFVWTLPPEIVDLLTPMKALGEACGFESCPSVTPGINVHIVPNTHYELGYDKNFFEHFTGNDPFFANTRVNMKSTLDNVITQLWEQKRRKFTLSDFPYFFKWWSRRDQSVRRMVYELIRQGRLHFVGGGWSMNEEGTTSYHGIIESFTYSLRKINVTFLDCARPLVAWQADVMGHSREMANLLALMGYTALFINPIGFDDELARMRRLALEFVWRGSDDLGPQSDIFTHKLFDGYWSPPGFCFSAFCNDPLLISSDTLFANMADRGEEFIKMITTRQSPNYNTSHVMVMMGRMMDFYDAALWFTNIDKLIDTVNSIAAKKGIKIRAFYSTPACYAKAVYDEGPELETKQDDFYPVAYDKKSYFSGLFSSHPSVKLLAREGLVYLQMAKQMQVLARLPDNSAAFEDLNWIYGVFQDHLIMSGVMRSEVKSYYIHKMYLAIQKSTLVLKQGLNKLSKNPSGIIYYRCFFNISSCQSSRGYYVMIMVYNPLAWPVTLPIRLPYVYMPSETRVYKPNGDLVPHSIIKIPDPILKIKYRYTRAEHELVFMAEDLPPIGYRSYFIEKYIGMRTKRTLIKNLKRKNNKKYLIRQTNPLSEDQAMLNDEDYDYDESNDTDKIRIDATDEPIRFTEDPNGKTDDDDGKSDKDGKLDMLDDTKKALWSQYENLIKKKGVNVSTDSTKYEISDDYDRLSLGETDDELTTVKDIEEDVDVTTSTGDTTDTTTYVTTSTDYHNATTEKNIHPTLTSITSTTFATTSTSTIVESSTKDTNATFEEDTSEAPESGRRMAADEISSDMFIENKYVRINLDPASMKISEMTLSNGIHINLDIQFYFYIPDDPDRLKKENVIKPGAYLFRAMHNDPVPIMDYMKTKVYKTDVVQEIHSEYSSWASLAVRLYVNRPVVEVDWVIGPVPFVDNLGKEVFIRYLTDLVNEGVFYTDSNGRQTIKRIRNLRPMYDSLNNDVVAGNYYPVTTKIYIEDLKKNIRFAVFNDRAQGGTSLYDGEIDLMIQRRLLTDDTGVNAIMNDTEFGEGIILRGKHYLYLSKADFKPNKIFEKKFAKEIELIPQVLVAPTDPFGDESKNKYFEKNNEKTFLKNKLPLGVHLLTLEQWNGGTVLLRLENFLEKSDLRGEGVKKVFIRELFTSIYIIDVRETTLAANIWLDEFEPKRFSQKEYFVRNFNEFYGGDVKKKVEFLTNETDPQFVPVNLDDGIKLSPQQIRTFVCTFEYI